MENNHKLPEPYELFGIECGDGWKSLYQPIIDYINDYNSKVDKEEDKIEILQIKEKFGRLRIYVSQHNDELNNMIRDAEEKSDETCEMCGSTTDVGHTSGYIITCCKDCAQNMSNRSKRSYIWFPLSLGKEKLTITPTE